ncbi:MAG: serine hydrolase domain-containing protein [Caldimonas sp.]
MRSPLRPLTRRLATTYLGRCLVFGRPTSHDQARMPQRGLTPSPVPVALVQHALPGGLGSLPVSARAGALPVPLAELLATTGTTAFVVLRRGRVIWELYPNHGARDLPQRCFSVTKSVASALLGLAVGAGCIESPQAPVGRWLPELRDPALAALTIEHLMQMRSGIGFREGILPWRDEPQTYYAADLRERLAFCRVSDPVGAFFHYNDWHPLLLSLLLERATGQSVTSWLQERLWNPLGAEHPGSMMVDRDDSRGLEHLESGLTASALDLAKFGQLYLQDGLCNGTRLLPEGWVRATTALEGVRTDADWFGYYRNRPWGRFLGGGSVYYKGLWWGRIDGPRHDFFAMGVLGQHVYVSPDTDTVIVRLSDRFPVGMWWPPLFRRIATEVASLDRDAPPARTAP